MLTARSVRRWRRESANMLMTSPRWVASFRLSWATQHALAGSALAELDEALHDAARELDEAADRYAVGPEPGEQHWFGGKALADIGRATVRLRSGALDGAAVVLDPVLSLSQGQRIN